MGVSRNMRPDAAIRAVSIHSAALTPSAVASPPASSAPTGIIANPTAMVAEVTRPNMMTVISKIVATSKRSLS